MKIYINRANENWICDRIRDEFIKHSSIDVVENVFDCDLIWLLAPWLWGQISPDILSSKPVVCTVHHVDVNKFNQSEFLLRDQFVNHYHVPNIHTFNFISQFVDSTKIKIISYWYDESKWFPIKSDEVDLKLNLPAGNPTIIGSFQRDTEGHDLSSPKLSKGPDVFCDIVESLSTKPFILLAGWRRQYIINRLQSAQIPFAYLEDATDSQLNDLYNLIDVYLVTSRYEGGPQAILECAATRTPIFSTDVGISRNILTPDCICDTISCFVENISNTLNFYDSDYNYNQAKAYEITTLINKYLNFFTEVTHLI